MLLINLGAANLVYTLYPMIVRLVKLRSISDRPQWIKAGGLASFVNQYLATILLTLDRVVMVQTHIKYLQMVTTSRICVSIAFVWIVSLLHISYYICKYHAKEVFQNIVLSWSILIICVCIFSYTYIFLVMKKRKKLLNLPNDLNTEKWKLRVRVPLLIIVSLTLFCLIPDILLCAKLVEYTSWFPVIFYLNVIMNPIIYILTPRRVKDQWIRCQRFMQNTWLSSK